MKTCMLALLVSLTFLATAVNATDFRIANCGSPTGHALRLIIVDQNVLQVRIMVRPHREWALTPTRAADQNIEGVTLYTFGNNSAVMEVDNTILSGNGGTLKMANDELSCV